MKEHAQIGELLAIYRELDDMDRREVGRHVQECTACATRLADYRAQDQDLTRLTDPRPGGRLREDFYAAVGAGGRQAPRSAGTHAWLMRIPVLAGQLAELAVLVLLIAGLGFTLRGRLQSTAIPLAAPGPESYSPATSQPAVAPVKTVDPMRAGNPAPAVELVSPSENQPSLVSLQGHAVVTSTTASQGSDGQTYIAQLDDSLWKLAEKYLGDGNRFGEIVEATRAKHTEDSSFALIENPGLILPGSKLWIPAAGAGPMVAAVTPSAEPAPKGGGLTGHLAFSFWNNASERCTYEINVIDVTACLTGPGACQATRRVFSLNNVSEPALSPGGDRLAFRGWGEPFEGSPYQDCAPAVKARHLASTTLDGTTFRDITGFWEDGHPDWSPDGQRLIFDSERNRDDVIRIYVVNTDGSNEQDLRIAGQYPSWAPDNQRFVYRGCDLNGNRCGLWLANAFPAKSWETGVNMIGPAVQDERAAHPDWSPVADQIAYQSSKSGSWDLYLVNADGTGLRQLTSDPGIEGLPAWSPDGQWIAYLSNADGRWGIWGIRADGSERHLLFAFDGGSFTPLVVEPYRQRDWIDEQISWSK